MDSDKIFHQFYLKVDRYRFNRGSLVNVGFIFTVKYCDYIAMHDVDLLPLNLNLNYDYPKYGIYHVASPQYHPLYNYPTFIGGILILRREIYSKVNGFSNQYWGWGLEDDEFYMRLREENFIIERPSNLTTGKFNTFRHIHSKSLIRKRDTLKCFNQSNVTRKRDRETGVSNVKYTIHSKQNILIDGVTAIILNIKLKCNITQTPWCDCYH